MADAQRWLRGYARVRLTGADLPAFFNRCVRAGIILRDVRAEDALTCTVSLPVSRLEAAGKIARRCGCGWEVLARTGMPEGVRRLRRRRGVLVLLGLVFAGLMLSSLFVWEIRVTENDSSVPDARILRVLADHGVGVGSFWPAFRGERIRTQALLELPELRFLAVNVRGSRAAVEVRAAIPRPEIFDPALPADVTAGRSGIVESVRAFAGMPRVSRGDAVTEGQLLITGDAAFPHARGEVRAYTYYEMTASAPLSRPVKEPNGRSSRRFALILGEKRINFYAGSGILPADCDKMTREWTLRAENAFSLPVRLVMEVRTPYVLRETAADPAACQQELERQLLCRLDRTLGERGEVLESRFTAAMTEGRLVVTLRAKCLESIDRDLPRN